MFSLGHARNVEAPSRAGDLLSPRTPGAIKIKRQRDGLGIKASLSLKMKRDAAELADPLHPFPRSLQNSVDNRSTVTVSSLFVLLRRAHKSAFVMCGIAPPGHRGTNPHVLTPFTNRRRIAASFPSFQTLKRDPGDEFASPCCG